MPDEQRSRSVLILHGAPDEAAVWYPVVEEVAAQGTVCEAIDLPGHGSNDSNQPHSIEGYADWVEAYLTERGLTDLVLVGHSMGALIALEVAGRRNQRLGGIVLFAVGHPMTVAPFLLDAAETDIERAIALIGKWSTEPTSDDEVANRAKRHTDLSLSQREGTIARALHACNNYDAALETAEKVQILSTVVTAELERMVPRAAGEPIMERIESVRRIVMPGVGHASQDEAPSAVAAIIVDAATA